MGNKLDSEGLRARIRRYERKRRDEYQEALESSLKDFADENERLRMRVAELEEQIDLILLRPRASGRHAEADALEPSESGVHRRVDAGAANAWGRHG